MSKSNVHLMLLLDDIRHLILTEISMIFWLFHEFEKDHNLFFIKYGVCGHSKGSLVGLGAEGGIDHSYLLPT